MTALSIQPTFPIFTDSDGTALENGFIWIGVAGSEPISTPLTAYWDAALTQVVTQPVRTRGGYPLNGTAIGRLYVNSDYSIKVRNRNGFDLYSSLTATERFGDLINASQVVYNPSGTGAVATTVQAKLRESVSVLDFGAVGDGVADDTAAIQAALNTAHSVFLPQGTYKITSQLVFGASCSGLVGEGMYLSVISKTFNGNAILCDTNGAVIQNLGINGNGATYTDGGIVPRGYNILIQHCRINDTADSPIKVAGAVGSNALAATYLRVDSCFLNPTNAATTYAIRSITSDDAALPTCRVFSNLSGGSSLVDFSGMNYAVLENSLGTLIKFSSTSSKIRIQGNRFTNTATNLVIYGQDHAIDGNFWGFGATFGLSVDTSASGIYFGPNNIIVVGSSGLQSISDGASIGSASLNNLSTQLKTGVFTWTAVTTNPTLGNASNSLYYKQEGRSCWVTAALVVGSTTNVGSGVYSFQIPYKSFVTAVGEALIKSSSGAWYQGSIIVQGGSSQANIYLFDGVTVQFGSASIALSTGAEIYFTLNYLISPT